MSNHVLFEIGIEELPARFIDDAESQLFVKTEEWLKKANITYESIKTYSTPRRLAIMIGNIAEEQKTIREEARGPQLKIAKDESGNWTKAALGFVKGQGKQPEDIYVKEIKGQEYIFVEKVIEGRKTVEILPEFKDIITSIHFPQTMRWGEGTFRFARPIRWILALFNDQVIPFEVANVTSNNVTFGHRFLGKESVITDPTRYENILEENYVIVDPERRENIILKQIHELESKINARIVVNDSLLNEVRNLVEYPTVFHGQFEEEYLQLPEEPLITSMQEHQRYFPVKSKEDDTLLPYFVSVRNGDNRELNNVVRGNEKVLRARLADAVFFYEEDKKYSIDFYIHKLKTVVFQEKIGTIYEKLTNVTKITEKISERLNVNEEVATNSLRAAEICKFDLMTSMVNEFPELQGVMGEKYALYYKEKEVVAKAIREHYLPIQANGELPKTIEGAIVSIADKLDTIVSCFSVNLIPSSSQDPLGLRRQAIGILRILHENKWNISVEWLLEVAAHIYQIEKLEVKQQLQQFFNNRAAYIMGENDIEQDIIQSVLANGIGTFHYTMEKAKVLSVKRNDPAFKQIEEALVRIMNVGKKQDSSSVDETLFETDSEKQLFETYVHVKDSFIQYDEQYDTEKALLELTRLAEPIHQFFEHTMVMAEDEKIRANRLALVQQISALIHQYADVTLIEWKQHH